MTRAFIFPGQGSQSVGMGKDLYDTFPEARDVFEEIDESLNRKLSKMIFEGPESDLNLTENTQPALMAVSMAAVRVLEKQKGIKLHQACMFVAGHSLGEYSALTATDSIQLSQTAKLLKLRGESMQKAVPVGVGAMAAILGPSFEEVKQIAKDSGSEVANDNSVGQVVISGRKENVEAAIALALDRGAKRALLLPVSAPFHCSLMQPAADAMAYALEGAEIMAPSVPVVSNVTAQGVNEPAEIRSLLVQQITGMVRWRESVLWMKAQGVDEMIELGAGKVLNGLVKRIDKDIAVESISTPAQIEALVEKIKS